MRKDDMNYTCKDYWSWPDDERWELIDGVAYNMSPAPTTQHQRISMLISSRIYNLLEGSECEAYAAPFDVYLPGSAEQEFSSINTIVQPDIVVICDTTKIIDKGCMGAPDLIVEILSPSTGKKDLNEKFRLYEREGVKEYWVIDPGNRYINLFKLISEGDKSGTYDSGEVFEPSSDWNPKVGSAVSGVVEGVSIHPDELFL